MAGFRFANVILLGSAALIGCSGACSAFSSADTPTPTDAGAESGTDAAVEVPDAGADALVDVAPRAKTYRDGIMASNPLAYWRMGAPAGSKTIVDETLGQNDLTLEGNAKAGAPGALGGDGDTAVTFDGTTSSRAAAKNARVFDFLSNAPFTIELWAKRDEKVDGGPGGYFEALVAHTEGAAGNRNGFLLYVKPTTNLPDTSAPLSAFELHALAAKETATILRPPVPAGEWGYYAAVFDGTSLRLLVNAQVSSPAVASGSITANAARMLIGGAEGRDAFLGSIDEVAIYGRALGTPELVEHYDLGRKL